MSTCTVLICILIVHGNPSLHESLLSRPGEDTDATEQPIPIPDNGASEYHESMIAAYLGTSTICIMQACSYLLII